MIKLDYKLTQEETVRYYEMILNNSRETGVARGFAMIWLPALLLAVMIGLKLYDWYYWLAFIFLSLLWVFIFSPKLYRDLTRTAAVRKVKDARIENKNIKAEIKGESFTVNGEGKQPVNYVTYYDTVVVAFSDNTNLIVPERVFKGNEDLMEEFLKALVLSVKNYQENK